MTTIISFVILLGVLIFVHELGHFAVAKLIGVKVLRFSLGFGPILLRYQKGETEYAISAFPLGGYVKFHGGDLTGEVEDDEDKERAFPSRPVWERMLTVVAGPLMNIILAVFLFSAIALQGTQARMATVGDVSEGLPAKEAGIMAGDKVVAVDGKEVSTWDEMAMAIYNSRGNELQIAVQRGAERMTFKVTPKMVAEGAEKEPRPVVGIKWSGEVVPRNDGVSLLRAPVEGVKQTWEYSVMTLEVVGKLVTGRGSRDDVGGPVAIAGLAGDAMRAGIMAFVYLMAVLSVNLGVLNLLPMPILDGGVLVFFLIEAVRGKPVSERTREIAQQVGFVVLVMLMIFLVYNDVARLIG
ncbi:RIP metalloprotease RseP [bacterium]|nr:MAG: RIP metalloprotease RseP [bacterium]